MEFQMRYPWWNPWQRMTLFELSLVGEAPIQLWYTSFWSELKIQVHTCLVPLQPPQHPFPNTSLLITIWPFKLRKYSRQLPSALASYCVYFHLLLREDYLDQPPTSALRTILPSYIPTSRSSYVVSGRDRLLGERLDQCGQVHLYKINAHDPLNRVRRLNHILGMRGRDLSVHFGNRQTWPSIGWSH